ncbi:MAG TPA: hypothetical protein DCX54_07110 [Flavobacteriales bacterium]|nr:hypothetical protein [Flavobacteriales bacterium]
MAEVNIKVEIQDASGKIRKRVTLAVSDSITKSDLSAGLKSHFSDILGDDKLDILVDPPDNRPLMGKLVSDGARVIARPRSSSSIFRIIDED